MGNKLSLRLKPAAPVSVEVRRRSETPPPLDMVTLRRKSEEFERQLEQDMIATRRFEELRRSSSRKDIRRSCGTATPSPKTPTTRSFSSVLQDDAYSATVELMFLIMETFKFEDVTIVEPIVSSHDGKKPAHQFLLCVDQKRYYPVLLAKNVAYNKYQASVTI